MNWYTSIALLVYIMSPCVSFAEQRDILLEFMSGIGDVLDHHQSRELYFPVISWYNPWMYDEAHLKEHIDKPWGAGVGLSYWNKKGNWSSIYLLTYENAFGYWRTIGGYAWEASLHPFVHHKNFHIGIGYTFGINSSFSSSSTPSIFFVPSASIGYDPVILQMTYIPSTFNKKNEYFACLKFKF